MGKFQVVAVLGLLSVLNTGALANWQDQFIGTPSFRLTDDPQLAKLNRELDDVEKSYASINRAHEAKEKEVKSAGNDIQAQNAILKKIEDDQVSHTKEIQDLESQVTSQTELKMKAEAEITTLSSEIPALEQDVNTKKDRLQKLFDNKAKAQSACEANNTPECQAKLADIEAKIDNVTKNIAADNEKIERKKAKLSANQQTITTASNKIERSVKRIANLKEAKKKLAEQKTRSEQEKNRLKDILAARSNELQRIAADLSRADLLVKRAQQEKETYRKNLVDRVLTINRQGANEGQDDGRYDGSELAHKIGESEGRSQGERDGRDDGTSNGRKRDYAIGHEIGQRDGEASANIDGEKNGRVDGTVRGNQDAANRISATDATAKANASDASSVGEKQGVVAGRERADRDGNRVGSQQGKEEAIKKNEASKLKEVSVGGDFAGTFARSIPSFPNGYKGRKFDPSKVFNRLVVRKAYEDGYRFRYQNAIVRSYGDEVGAVFDLNYNRSYDEYYQRYYAMKYPTDQNAGYNDGYRIAYDRAYPIAYDYSFEEYRTRFSANPDKGSDEYRSTYSANFARVYAAVYEDIRYASYMAHEAKTYKNEIESVTKKYREKRFAEVESVYKNGAVLQYVDSQVTDIGTKGVGVDDNILMPKEDYVVSVRVKNFGEKDASGAVVTLPNGTKATLPSIPAKSVVFVKGAVKSQAVSSDVGQVEKIASYVTFPLTLEKEIQGRFFRDASKGILNDYDAKNFTVELPIALSSLTLSEELEFNKENKLNLSVENKSSKKIATTIAVELTSSSQRTVKNTFAPLAVLDKSAKLQGASLLVDNMADLYELNTYGVSLKVNGVLVGQLASPMRAMAKLGYTESRSKVAVLANGEESAKDLLNMVEELGGMDTVAIIDASLGTTKAKVLANGVKGQKIVALPYGTTAALDELMKKSVQTSFVFAQDNKEFDSVKTKVKALENSKTVSFKFGTKGKSVATVLTNKLLNKSIADSNVMFVVDSAAVKEALPLASVMTKSNDELIAALTKVTEQSYFSPNEETKILLQGSMVRALHENLRINELYLASGGTFSRDKDIADKVKDDKSLLHNKVGNKVDTKAKKDSIGLFLFAYELFHVIENATREWKPLSSEFTTAINNRLFGTLFSKGALKDIKDSDDRIEDYSKSLYKQAAKAKGANAPFEYVISEPDRNPNPGRGDRH